MSAGRKYLTPTERAALLRAQSYLCATVGCEKSESNGPFEADHSTPNAFEAGKPDQLLCRTCHKAKTKLDVKAIAKAKRLNGTTSSQWSRREKRGALLRSARKLISRGFDKALSKRMNGEVVKR